MASSDFWADKDAAQRAVRKLGDKGEGEFLADDDLQWVLYSQLVIIGEAATRVPAEAQQEHASVPWSSAISLRHRIVHGYDSIDWKIVFQTVRDDLPALIRALERELPPH